jgi:tRNA threonylcarbamoyladenosine biosynthesis protein TsaB
LRDVAQPGSARRSGRRGRWFESSHPDHLLSQLLDFQAIGFFLQLRNALCQLITHNSQLITTYLLFVANILLLETATDTCSTAIAVHGEVVAFEDAPACLQHTAVLPGQIQRCLRAAGLKTDALDAIAVSRGPGSYTTLRTGVALAKGMCYALQKPLIAVDTLEALAWACRQTYAEQTSDDILFMPMLDARRNEVWAAVYDAGGNVKMAATPLLLDNNLFETHELLSDKRHFWVFCGNGVAKISEELITERMVRSDVVLCRANYLTVLAEKKWTARNFVSLSAFEPFYMKNPNITGSTKF